MQRAPSRTRAHHQRRLRPVGQIHDLQRPVQEDARQKHSLKQLLQQEISSLILLPLQHAELL